MAKSRKEPVYSDEDDAPEAVSLSTSKKAMKRQEEEVKKVHAAQNEKKKAQNRERDRKLKEQAENKKTKEKEAAEKSKSKGKGKRREGDDELMARMERAMKEAAEEDDEELSGEEFSFGDMEGNEVELGSEDDFGEMDEDESGSEDRMSLDEDESGGSDSEEEFTGFGDPNKAFISSEDEDEEELPPPTKRKSNPNHLPDELFTAAFAAKTTSASKKAAAEDESKAKRRKKRKRTGAGAKDIVLGSRIIRTLETPAQPKAPQIAQQPKKNKKFLERVLALKGAKSKAKTWERRPANIGIMRYDGPAAHFVRNR